MGTTTDFVTSTGQRRFSYLSGCMSPSNITSVVDEQYTRIRSGRGGGGGERERRKWKKMVNKVVEESKRSIYGSSKPLVFSYDAVSYSQNFDEGGGHRDAV
ncbi:hypothetical protein SSX86_014276 [Deinandra increscens subsp. villosa]|uniref:Uncharacterized protein n=1 Tax=Deinandra increscens subsp. villosa TaxID=3103831 RepID=A0AAP0D643_9ASTR